MCRRGYRSGYAGESLVKRPSPPFILSAPPQPLPAVLPEFLRPSAFGKTWEERDREAMLCDSPTLSDTLISAALGEASRAVPADGLWRHLPSLFATCVSSPVLVTPAKPQCFH